MKGLAVAVGGCTVALLLIALGLTALMGGAPAAAFPGEGAASPSGAPPGIDVLPGPDGPVSAAAVHAVAYAESMMGVPYVWGGSGPAGFDCSGLVWAAYRDTAAGFPRWGASDEFFHLPRVPAGAALLPGDLVFFADAGGIQHVGLYVGSDSGGEAMMIDAPHSGASVRFDPFEASLGAYWGDEWYAGATRPGA